MTFRLRLILFAAVGLGLVGAIACMAAIIGLWTTSARLRNATQTVFGKVDGALVVVQQRAERTRERVTASAITTESMASSLKEWAGRDVRQRLAQQMNLAEKSDKLRFAMQQADGWLELSESSAESVQQALSMLSAMGAQIDPESIDVVIVEIASLRSRLAEATGFVEKFHGHAAAMAEGEFSNERLEQAVQLALRAIATLSSLDARIETFEKRVEQTQTNLQARETSTIRWIHFVTIIVTTLIIWMAAGQVALAWLAWNHLRSTQTTSDEDRS